MKNRKWHASNQNALHAWNVYDSCGDLLPETKADAELMADAPGLLAALEAVEWVFIDESSSGKSLHLCPWCKRWKHNGHAQNCQRQTALRKAVGD